MEYCYLFIDEKKEWDDAKEDCAARGGQLAILDTVEKLEDVAALYGNTHYIITLKKSFQLFLKKSCSKSFEG